MSTDPVAIVRTARENFEAYVDSTLIAFGEGHDTINLGEVLVRLLNDVGVLYAAVDLLLGRTEPTD